MTGGAIGRGGKIGIAKTAIAAFGQTKPLSDLGHIGEQAFPVLVKHLRAARDFQDHIGTIGARAVAAHAMHTRFGFEMLLITIIDQRIQPFDTFHPDIAAASAVAAIGSAEFDKFFTAKRHAACAAISGADIDFGFIKKFHNGSSKAGRR